MQSDGHVIPLWSISACEAPPEEKLGKTQQRAVRGFEPPPAASHDGELATGPKARPLLFHGFVSWLAGETNRGTDSGFVVTCLTNSKARVMMTCLQLFGRDDNNGLA